jgi:hypothetical protein
MTKIKSPIIDVRPIVAPSFSLTLRAERASKVDAAAFGEHVRRNTPPCEMPRKYAELAFAQTMIQAAMAEIKAEVTNQVRRGNAANEHGVKLVVASGRSSYDFSKEPAAIKAADRLDKAKENLKTIHDRLAAAGKGKVKIGAPSLRATVA